ncbi:MAG: hypothetical protein RBU21_01195 [FCB group bacterium]|jgi:predicted transcriptional regulator of viral defense system|nr:hypothetical protein [FCB group bacterium]
MMTQTPRTVSITLKEVAETPRLDHPPLTVYRFSGDSLVAGIEAHEMDGVTVRVYNPEKTLADCFKFRNKIGMDIVLEALKRCRARKDFNVAKLLKYARICRVEKVMKPHLEAIL